MRSTLGLLLAVILAVSLMMAGCGQSAAPASPTAAPAAPTKAAEPAKAAEATKVPAAAAAQPTAAPAAKKVNFPEKGKSITLIVPVSAGSATDVGARLLATAMEKELGVPIQVVNKVGAGVQIGTTDLAQAKPDGYTIGMTNLPAVITTYLDPSRQAAFGRKDLAPIGLHVDDPSIVAVATDSKYKTLKDLFDEAKANPEKVKASTTGPLTHDHLNVLQWAKFSGAKFALVTFSAGGEAIPQLIGGHIDVYSGNVGAVVALVKNGQVRVLAVADKTANRFLPGVPTMESLGYKMYFSSSRGLSAPAGTPKEIIDILSDAMKKAVATEEHKKKMEEMGLTLRYLDPAEYTSHWDQMESSVQQLMKDLGM